MTRSKAAFRFAMRTLFEQNPRPYFWTFTLRKVIPIPDAIAAWNKLSKALWKYGRMPGTSEQTITGLRVFELHEGGHGLHIHAIFSRRISIHAVRRRAEQFGFFWLDVRRVRSEEDMEHVSDYLSAYFTKSERPPCLKGKRLWAAIGNWGQTKCKDVVIDSEFGAAFRARRKVIDAEAKIAAMVRRPYRKESTMETMVWAKFHVLEVSSSHREPLRPHLWHYFHDRMPDQTFEDVEAAWDALIPDEKKLCPFTEIW